MVGKCALDEGMGGPEVHGLLKIPGGVTRELWGRCPYVGGDYLPPPIDRYGDNGLNSADFVLFTFYEFSPDDLPAAVDLSVEDIVLGSGGDALTESDFEVELFFEDDWFTLEVDLALLWNICIRSKKNFVFRRDFVVPRVFHDRPCAGDLVCGEGSGNAGGDRDDLAGGFHLFTCSGTYPA